MNGGSYVCGVAWSGRAWREWQAGQVEIFCSCLVGLARWLAAQDARIMALLGSGWGREEKKPTCETLCDCCECDCAIF